MYPSLLHWVQGPCQDIDGPNNQWGIHSNQTVLNGPSIAHVLDSTCLSWRWQCCSQFKRMTINQSMRIIYREVIDIILGIPPPSHSLSLADHKQYVSFSIDFSHIVASYSFAHHCPSHISVAICVSIIWTIGGGRRGCGRFPRLTRTYIGSVVLGEVYPWVLDWAYGWSRSCIRYLSRFLLVVTRCKAEIWYRERIWSSNLLYNNYNIWSKSSSRHLVRIWVWVELLRPVGI